MTKIKICGITNLRDALFAARYGADALGFVFAESPRKINAVSAARIINQLPLFVFKIGVFVNAKKDDVLGILHTCRLDALQFHGEENNRYCGFFRKYCKIIKAIRIKDTIPMKIIRQYKNIDAYLFDAYDKNIYGGTGRSFSWNILKNIPRHKPIIISGGIRPNNVIAVIKKLNPYAIDISSGVEAYPGKKNLKQLKTLIQTIKRKGV